MRLMAFVSVLVIVTMSCSSARAPRGETSVHLLELRETVPPPNVVVRKARWSHSLDADEAGMGRGDVLAIRDGAVAFRSSGRMCMFSAADGTTRWCGTDGRSPTFAANVFAYAAIYGPIYGLDAATGARLWSFSYPTSPKIAAHYEVRPQHAVWGRHGMFVVARFDGGGVHGSPSFGELSPSGSLQWSVDMSVVSRAPRVSFPYILEEEVTSGGTIFGRLHVFRAGARGGPIATIDNVSEVLSVTPTNVFAKGGQMNEGESASITFDLKVIDIRTARVRADYRFAPDYASNLDRLRRGEFDRIDQASMLAVDHDNLYAIVGRTIYLYRLGHVAGQHPVMLNGEYAAGPYAGVVYVRRTDGIWSLRWNGGTVAARRLSSSTVPLTAAAAWGAIVYMAFADGHVEGIASSSGRLLLEARTCGDSQLIAAKTGLYVICPAAHRVLAFLMPRS